MIYMLVTILTSALVSIVIGNIVGIYYLNKNDRDWQNVFDEVTKVTIEEVQKLKKVKCTLFNAHF